MSLWTKIAPPAWFPTAVATSRGWENPVTHEILVASGTILDAADAQAAHISKIYADEPFYGPGSTAVFSIWFNQPVIVTGSPQLNVRFNQQNEAASYTSGSGTSILLFSYTVTSSDECTAGQLHIVSLSLNGGAIVDAYGANIPASLVTTTTAAQSSLVQPTGGIIPVNLRTSYPFRMAKIPVYQVSVLVFPVGLLTYYIDPINGNDGNSGLSPSHAWRTSGPAQGLVGVVLMYHAVNGWELYSYPGMTADQADLTADEVDLPASNF